MAAVMMPFVQRLAEAEARNRTLLCVGLDPDPARFPGAWKGDPARMHDFCTAIVDATHDLVLAYKPQIAYFAAHRAEDQLERTIAHIRRVAPGLPVILDAKRGDIGPSAEQYAREAFERYAADAVTLSPLLGFDSIEPYLRYPGKGLFVLCRTSNPGGAELQGQTLDGGELLYEHIARLVAQRWNAGGQLGLVVGATWPHELERVRRIAPTLPILVPGIGAQGGDAAAAVRAGWRGAAAGGGSDPPVTSSGPLVVSSSRAVLYAGSGDDFAAAARAAAIAARDELEAARRAAVAQSATP